MRPAVRSTNWHWALFGNGIKSTFARQAKPQPSGFLLAGSLVFARALPRPPALVIQAGVEPAVWAIGVLVMTPRFTLYPAG